MKSKILSVRKAKTFIFFIVYMLVSIGTVATTWGVEEDYDGVYAGTFSGDDNGVWVALIDSNSENIFLTHSTENGNADGGNPLFEEYGGVGEFWGITQLYGTAIEGSINLANDSISGLWESIYDQSGSFTGSAVTSNAYEGSYSGTFEGDLTGTWSLTIDSDGYLTGSAIESGNTYPFIGGCHPDGYIIVFGEDDYASTYAASALITNGSISG
jgi:hypothetical protein